MRFPDERVAEVCQLGPVKASELLDKVKAGDLSALADWTVRAAYKKLIRGGASHAEALRHTRTLLSRVNLNPKLVT